MKLTYRQLYERAMRYVGWAPEDLATDAALLAQAQSWPNLAMDDILRMGAWPWLYLTATVALPLGSRSAVLPADFQALAADTGVRLVGQSCLLARLSREQIHQAVALNRTGRPTGYAVEYDGARWRLLLDAAADTAYGVAVGYVRTLPAMTTQTLDVAAPLPEGLHDVLRLGTLCIAEEEVDRAAGGRLRPLYEQAKLQAWQRRETDPRPLGTLRRFGPGRPVPEIAPTIPPVTVL